MSIDFSTLKGLTIPEGNVTKITDASGRVLWSAVKPATITLSFAKNGNAPIGNVTSLVINGIDYSQSEYANNLSTTEITVAIGTVITCKILTAPTSMGTINLNTNANVVLWGTGEYQYTVVGDATITVSSAMNFTPQTGTQPYGKIFITEL